MRFGQIPARFDPAARGRQIAGMTHARRTPILAGLAALLALTGCSSGTGPGAAGAPSGSASGSPSAPATTSTLPAATAPPAACPSVGTAAIPDGSWTGPLTVKVRGIAPETTTRGTGSGELHVVVEGGRVTGGTWALTWDSAGPSTAKEAQSTVQLHGQIAGTVTGTAAEPVLLGEWTVTGSAAVTAPVTATASIDETGHGRAALVVRTTSCDGVAGKFAASFRSTDPYAASDATARWAGRRTG
jgi:hypothetical protein